MVVSAGVLVVLLAAWLFRADMPGDILHKNTAAAVAVESDGLVRLPPLAVPFSTFASPEAKAAFFRSQQIAKAFAARGSMSIAAEREAVSEYFQPALAQVKSLYPVTSVRSAIAGVGVDIVTPRGGISPENAHRVLLNLHGGGFRVGAGVISALESIPVASLGRIQVISVDYRQAPEYEYPAATQDVVAVYRELLKMYSPAAIGIYGCSAGGVLTAEVVAWLAVAKLPEPGAVGIFCASAAGWSGGDSGTMALPLSGIDLTPDAIAGPHPQVSNALYFRDADFSDPLVLPFRSPALLAKFPPTLLLTATRDIAMSGALNTHAELTRLGVDAELHVWDGLGHAFFTNEPELRETHEALDVITRFFAKHLIATPSH